MGALFAGIVRAPMTSVLMIFEMTRDYAVIVPLMIANLASLFISSALPEGAHLRGPGAAGRHPSAKPENEREEFHGRTVSQLMRKTAEILPGTAQPP